MSDSAVDASVTVDSRGRFDMRVSRCEGERGWTAYPYMIEGSGSQTPPRPGVAGRLIAAVGMGIGGSKQHCLTLGIKSEASAKSGAQFKRRRCPVRSRRV